MSKLVSGSANLLPTAVFFAVNSFALVVCFAASILLLRLERHKKVLYRLAFYQLLFAMAYSILEALQMAFVTNNSYPDDTKSGETAHSALVGWVALFTGTQWAKLSFATWLLFHSCFFSFAACDRNFQKLEAFYVVVSLLTPSLIAGLPLTTGSYLLRTNRSCVIDQIYVEARLLLWNAPAIIALLLMSVIATVAVVRLIRYWKAKCEQIKNQFQSSLAQFLPLAVFPVLFVVFGVLPAAILGRVYATPHTSNKGVSITNAVCVTMWSLSSGISVIAHIWCIRRKRERDCSNPVVKLSLDNFVISKAACLSYSESHLK